VLSRVHRSSSVRKNENTFSIEACLVGIKLVLLSFLEKFRHYEL